MGRTQCFKANVAYSLYGVLKGSSANGCSKKTYINSFFTTFGAESFTGPMGLGVDYGNSQCANEAPDNMYLDDDAVAADDDYLDDQYQFYNYKEYTSTGTGCANGNFVTDSYTGAFCHGQNYVATLDKLSDFNSQLQNFDCTQIYDGSQEVEDLDNDDQDYNFEEMDAVNLLAFSKSCSLRQYPNDCPDPYGIKRKYARQINNAFYLRTSGHRDILQKLMAYTTYVFAALGVLLLTMAFLIRQRLQGNRKNNTKQNRKKERKSRSKTRKSSRNRGISRTRSGESAESSKASKEGSTVERIGSAIAGATSSYQAPQWTAFRGSNASRSPTRTEEIANVETESGTVNIAITETLRDAFQSNEEGSSTRKNRVKAGSFSKFFRNNNES